MNVRLVFCSGAIETVSKLTMVTPIIGRPLPLRTTGTSSLAGGTKAAEAHEAQRESTREVFVNIIQL